MKEMYITFKTRDCRGKLTLYEYHCFRIYYKYVEPKLSITKI